MSRAGRTAGVLDVDVVRRTRVLLRSAVTLAVTTLTLLTPTFVAAPAAAEDGDGDEPVLPVQVLVTEVDPVVLRPDEDLVVEVTLRNTGTTTVAEPRVTLALRPDGFISRSSLDLWRGAGPLGDAGVPLVDREIDEPLEPGAVHRERFRVEADALPLPASADAWGARGLAATVVDTADPTRVRLGVARTFLLWYPADQVTATRATVLVPLVGPPVDPYRDAWADELERLAEGRLGAVLDATAEASHVSWVVDPWLVDVGTAEPGSGDGSGSGDDGDDDGAGATSSPSAGADDGDGDGAGEDGAGDGGAAGSADEPAGDGSPDDAATGDLTTEALVGRAGPAIRAWVERLLDATVDRDVHLLPYGDADVAALAHTGSGGVLTTARERSAEVASRTDLPDGAPSAVLVPADERPDLRTAALTAARAGSALVVGPGRLPTPSVLTYTPSGRTTVATAAGESTVLVPDPRLSRALVTGRVPVGGLLEPLPEVTGGPVTTELDVTPAAAAQDLLAELAVITRERPSDARHVLLTVPRDWSPDPEVARAQLEALDAVPWVRPEPVSTLVGTPDDGIDRGTLPSSSVDPDEVSGREIAAMRRALDLRADVAGMVPEPDELLGDPTAELLAMTSVAWRADPAGREDLVAGADGRTDALLSRVGVVPGSTVNLLSTSGELRLRVSNALDQPVTVVVQPRPGDWRLRVDRSVTVTVPAGGEELVRIPVHAIQSADVPTTIELRTTDGELVDDSTVLTVRVRADWEGIGTAVIGGLLVLLVVVGLVRTIRRGRTPRRAEPVAAGPDALSPEAVDELEAAAAAAIDRAAHSRGGPASPSAGAAGSVDAPRPPDTPDSTPEAPDERR